MDRAAAFLRKRPNTLVLVSSLGFFAIFSTTISKSPVLPLFVAALGGRAGTLGLIAAISPLAGILFSFPIGFLADRLGKKRLILLSASVFCAAPLLYLVVREPLWLIPIRFFHGLGTAILGPVASALILSEHPESRGAKLGIYSSATLVGRSLAPMLGGAIISLFAFLGPNWNYRLVYAAAFLLSIPGLVLALLLPEDGRGDKGGEGQGSSRPPLVGKVRPSDFASSLVAFLANRSLLGTGLVEMATYFAYGGFETYLPLHLKASGLPAYEIGLVFSVQILSIALTKPLFGRLSDRIDRRLQILVGILVLGASFAIIPLTSGLLAAMVLGVVFGLALSFSTVATNSYIADIASQDELGASLGALSAIMDIGHSSGPLLIGIIIGSTSLSLGFATGGLVCGLAALAFIILAFGGRSAVGKKL